MTKKELIDHLNSAHDMDEIYVMVSIEKLPERARENRLDMDFNECHTKYHITQVTHDQFHSTIHIPRIVI